MTLNLWLQNYQILINDDQMLILCLSYFITTVRTNQFRLNILACTFPKFYVYKHKGWINAMIMIWLAEHGWELHLKPKFLVTAKAYLSATFGPNFSDFFSFMPSLSVCSRSVSLNKVAPNPWNSLIAPLYFSIFSYLVHIPNHIDIRKPWKFVAPETW